MTMIEATLPRAPRKLRRARNIPRQLPPLSQRPLPRTAAQAAREVRQPALGPAAVAAAAANLPGSNQAAAGASLPVPGRTRRSRPIDTPLGPPTLWESILLLLGAGIIEPLNVMADTVLGD